MRKLLFIGKDTLFTIQWYYLTVLQYNVIFIFIVNNTYKHGLLVEG